VVEITYHNARKNLLAGVYDDVWSDNRRLKIRGSVNKAPAAFEAIAGITFADPIPCTSQEVDYLIVPLLEAKTLPAGCGLKSWRYYT
jgi:hypothetical protein